MRRPGPKAARRTRVALVVGTDVDVGATDVVETDVEVRPPGTPLVSNFRGLLCDRFLWFLRGLEGAGVRRALRVARRSVRADGEGVDAVPPARELDDNAPAGSWIRKSATALNATITLRLRTTCRFCTVTPPSHYGARPEEWQASDAILRNCRERDAPPVALSRAD
jgi:hypothetical protein